MSATSADLNAEDEDGCGWRRGSRDPGRPATRTACDPSVLAGRRQAAPVRGCPSHRAVRLCSELRPPVGNVSFCSPLRLWRSAVI